MCREEDIDVFVTVEDIAGYAKICSHELFVCPGGYPQCISAVSGEVGYIQSSGCRMRFIYRRRKGEKEIYNCQSWSVYDKERPPCDGWYFVKEEVHDSVYIRYYNGCGFIAHSGGRDDECYYMWRYWRPTTQSEKRYGAV